MTFYTNENGVSPIIATLLLILITLIAASGLALITGQMQADYIDRVERVARVEGENLKIVDIELFNNSSAAIPRIHQLNFINITIYNLDIKESRILGIAINNRHVWNFTAGTRTRPFNYKFNYTNRLSIPGGSYRIAEINLSNLTGTGKIFNNDTIHIEIMTSNVRIFERSFSPPIALPVVQFGSEKVNRTPAGLPIFHDFLILDASRSFDPDPDGFIISYQWGVWNNSRIVGGVRVGEPVHDFNLSGQKARPTLPINATNVAVSLKIIDNTNMTSIIHNFTTLPGPFRTP